jgi:septal ring factor EnvC (AmiA/AmiB activator)
VKNLEALETLAKRNGHSSGGNYSSPAAEIARLTTELQQLETMIFEVEHTIRELDLSHAMQMRSELKADQDDGRDALAELEAEFKTRIAILQEQLLAMGADLDSINSGTN